MSYPREGRILRKDFVKMIGGKKTAVANAIKKGTITLIKVGSTHYVDCSDKGVADMFAKYFVLDGATDVEVIAGPTVVASSPISQKEVPPAEDPRPDPEEKPAVSYSIDPVEALRRKFLPEAGDTIALLKQKADAMKAIENAEVEKLKRLRLQGEVIPTNDVEILFETSFKAVIASFYEFCTSAAMMFTHELGGTKDDQIRIEDNLRTSFEETVDKAREVSSKQIEVMQDNFSTKAGRGERK